MGCGRSKESKIQPDKEDDITVKVYHHNTESFTTSSTLSTSNGKGNKGQVLVALVKNAILYFVVHPGPEIEIIAQVSHTKQHNQYIDFCQWSPKSDLLVTASSDKKAFLWNCQNLESVSSIPLILSDNADIAVTCLDWSENGKIFAVGTTQGQITVWSQSGKLLHTWQAHSSSGATAVKINPSNNLVASGGNEDTCVYSLQNRNALLLCWNSTEITAMAWMASDKFIVGEISGLITIDQVLDKDFRQLSEYDEEDFIPASEPLARLDSHVGGIYKFSMHPIKANLCASCSVDCTIVIWDLDAAEKMKELKGHFGYVIDALWLKSGNLASASYDGTVKIWNMPEPKTPLTLQEGLGYVNSLSATKSGQYIASGGQDGQVYFWNVDSGSLVTKFTNQGRIMSVAFNSSDSKVAVTSYASLTLLQLSYNHRKAPMNK